MDGKNISTAALHRLPIYLRYLKSLPGSQNAVSATAIASALGLGQVQVRKDLALASGSGKPKVGYSVPMLIYELECFLGFRDTDYAVVIGTDSFGKALIQDERCAGYGFRILATFDPSPETTGCYTMPFLMEFCQKNQIQIGILSCAASQAQSLCDVMVKAGLRIIINFTPVLLQTPPNIAVNQPDVAAAIALFSKNALHSGA